MRSTKLGSSRRVGGRACVGALIGTMAIGAPVASGQSGRAVKAKPARTLALNETGHLKLTSKRAFTLNEKGTASGSINGTIYIHLKIVSVNRVTAEINIYPSGGSLTGNASASYHSGGPTASFAGTMSITRGTGTYAHAHGSGLSFSGTVQRLNDSITVHLSGRLSD